MKRMKVVVECEFEFPDDYEVAPDFEGTPSLKIDGDIFIPSIHWLRQAIFLEGSSFGQHETAPTRGFEPLTVEENDEIMNYLTVEGSHVEMAKDQSAEEERKSSE